MDKFAAFLMCCFLNYEILSYNEHYNKGQSIGRASFTSSFGHPNAMGFVDVHGYYASDFYEINPSIGLILGNETVYLSITYNVYDFYEGFEMDRSWMRTHKINWKF